MPWRRKLSNFPKSSEGMADTLPLKLFACRQSRNPGNRQSKPSQHPIKKIKKMRTGKIASLPHAIREALNTRLRDGERPENIVNWSNK